MSAPKNPFGDFKRQKGYVGHQDDLLTSIFGFYAYFTYRGTD